MSRYNDEASFHNVNSDIARLFKHLPQIDFSKLSIPIRFSR